MKKTAGMTAGVSLDVNRVGRHRRVHERAGFQLGVDARPHSRHFHLAVGSVGCRNESGMSAFAGCRSTTTVSETQTSSDNEHQDKSDEQDRNADQLGGCRVYDGGGL